MSSFNTWKSNRVLIIVIVATSLTEVKPLRQAEILVNESVFISCFSKEVKSIQWHHTPPRKKSNVYVYSGTRFYPPYNRGRFRVDTDLTTNMHTLTITNVMHEDAGLYECKDDVLSGVFGSTYLTVLDSNPVCTSNMNPNGFAGPNTCNIKQENMTFNCAVSFSGNSPNLKWSALNSNQSLRSPVCERKYNRINCSLSMKADPSFDGFTFICQTTSSNDARLRCNIDDIRIEYFFGNYEAAEKRVGDNVTCMVARNVQIHYNWTIQQTNKDNIFSANRMILFQEPGFYKCSVKYNIRNVTCFATIVAVNVSNIDYEETAAESSKVSREQSKALSIGVSIGMFMCLFAVVIAFVLYKCCVKAYRPSQKSKRLLPSRVITTPGVEGPRYALTNCPRGFCIIINNFDFDKQKCPWLKSRSGAGAEIEALKKLFEELKFQVDTRENLPADEMTNCLTEFRDRDHSASDAFVCCLLSHGEKGRIDATDGQIPVIKLMELFYDRNCPGLAGKPKLFFIGTCQGNREFNSYGQSFPEAKKDHNDLVPSTGSLILHEIKEVEPYIHYEDRADEKCEIMPPASAQSISSGREGRGRLLPEVKNDPDDLVPSTDSLNLHNSKGADRPGIVRELVPSGADFIVSYACLPETIAWHDSKQGGLYVQALCRHLNQNLEIDIALRNVSQEVKDILNTYDKKGENYSRQDPFHIIMPPHKLLFLGSA